MYYCDAQLSAHEACCLACLPCNPGCYSSHLNSDKWSQAMPLTYTLNHLSQGSYVHITSSRQGGTLYIFLLPKLCSCKVCRCIHVVSLSRTLAVRLYYVVTWWEYMMLHACLQLKPYLTM